MHGLSREMQHVQYVDGQFWLPMRVKISEDILNIHSKLVQGYEIELMCMCMYSTVIKLLISL